MTEEKIIILDFGSQYTQLIARKVRENKVFCEIYPYNKLPEPDNSVKGIILSGSHHSVNDNDSPRLALSRLYNDLPILGICYGAQLIAQLNEGNVQASAIREFGRASLAKINTSNGLFKNIQTGTQVWMSHGDTITKISDNFETIASTNDVEIAAYKHKSKPLYGIQFHPEVTHTLEGSKIINNFLTEVCGCSGSWTAEKFVENSIQEIKDLVANEQVVMGLSGGVDSTVAATLIHKAIGSRLHCIFVDNGLLRKGEYEQVLDSYKEMGLNIKGVNATDRFLDELEGVSEPEEKRKIIGRIFIEVFDEEAHKIQNVNWLGQGTIYPDVIESLSVNGPSATIKSHHNVGGLPDTMKLKVLEPLRMLFKDEVRNVGYELEITENILKRHPFPGPGLSIRMLGAIDRPKLNMLKDADAIFIDGLKKHGQYDKVWQAGAIFLPVHSVGVMGDARTYENVICLRAVLSTDGMTADWAHLPYEFLAGISTQIINNVKGINRVVYDISSKPPATIEWE